MGLDLSLVGTGCVVISDGKIILQRLITSKKDGDSYNKELERLLNIIKEIPIQEVDVAVIEGVAFMAKNTTSLVQLSGLNYLCRYFLKRAMVDFLIVAPTTLKKFITEKGNCEKELILLQIYKRYGVSFSDHNLADAYALAQIGAAVIGENKKKLTNRQQEVVDLIKQQYGGTKND